ncbi:hypothetical protein OSB04_028272 [Centaurea solstitialis]|uniref:Uncharacterized protein n=1 Tax=Centaurea solstitialis TaxID=347529 RepID=A0AA38SSB8_9ASTR|nr:hypothetical protein OSB04_028272 [Centaurea solstitialis]
MGREVGELEELRGFLDVSKPKRGEVDKVVWNFDLIGGFSIKALRLLIEEKRMVVGIEADPVTSMEDLIEKGDQRGTSAKGRARVGIWWYSTTIKESWRRSFLKSKEECLNGSGKDKGNFKWIGEHGSQTRLMFEDGRKNWILEFEGCVRGCSELFSGLFGDDFAAILFDDIKKSFCRSASNCCYAFFGCQNRFCYRKMTFPGSLPLVN